MTAKWLADDEDMPLSTARDRVATQDNRSALGHSVERGLGKRAAGSFLDQKAGTVVVNVTDAKAAKVAKAKGATPRLVQRSTSDLQRAQSVALKRLGGVVGSAGIDPMTNSVVINVPRQQVKQAEKAVRGLDGVTVEAGGDTTTTTANIYGGQEITYASGGKNWFCSLGFNALKGTTPVFVTAGHCAPGLPTYKRNGITVGTAQAKSFPSNDYAYSSLTSSWTPQGGVYQYNGYQSLVKGSTAVGVNGAICKSGRTTQWTCGSVTATNVSVNYGGQWVFGMTKYSACVEGGDSGGSNISGNQAQGITSGANLYQVGDRAVCGQRLGYPNVSYHQPINEVLNAYGLKLKLG